MVGVSEAEVMSSYRTTETAYWSYALGGSAALLFFGMVASVMAARLAWRKQQMDMVRATYRVATEGASEGFYMLRPLFADDRLADFEIVDCNERGAAFYCTTRSELLGRRFSMLNSAASIPALLSTYGAVLASGFHEDEILAACARWARSQADCGSDWKTVAVKNGHGDQLGRDQQTLTPKILQIQHPAGPAPVVLHLHGDLVHLLDGAGQVLCISA
jgi:hypothetical protein